MKPALALLLAAAAALALPARRAAAAPDGFENPALSTTTLTLPGDKRLSVELALTPEEQERGLMYRTEMAPDTGMLFVFPSEQVEAFWMKNTWMDLDMVYIGADKRITKIFRRVPRSYPDTPDDKVAVVHALARYVLEIPADAARHYHLKEGQRLAFDAAPRERPAPPAAPRYPLAPPAGSN